jgi:hypothetical protein
MEFVAETPPSKCPYMAETAPAESPNIESQPSGSCPMSGESGQTCPFARQVGAFDNVHAATDLHQEIIERVSTI